MGAPGRLDARRAAAALTAAGRKQPQPGSSCCPVGLWSCRAVWDVSSARGAKVPGWGDRPCNTRSSPSPVSRCSSMLRLGAHRLLPHARQQQQTAGAAPLASVLAGNDRRRWHLYVHEGHDVQVALWRNMRLATQLPDVKAGNIGTPAHALNSTNPALTRFRLGPTSDCALNLRDAAAKVGVYHACWQLRRPPGPLLSWHRGSKVCNTGCVEPCPRRIFASSRGRL